MAAIRMSFLEDDSTLGDEENENQKRSILMNTELREFILRILSHVQAGEEFYFLKLECIWILISLSLTGKDTVQLLLQELEMPGSSENGHILSKLEINLSSEPLDLKMISHVLNLLGNIGSDDQFAWLEIINKTSLLNLLKVVSENRPELILGRDMLTDYACWITSMLAKFAKHFNFEAEVRLILIKIAHTGLNSGDQKTTRQAVKALKHLSEQYEESDVDVIATKECI